MNAVKRFLGLIWIALAPVLMWLMASQAIEKIGKATEGIAKTNTTLQWAIILMIFIPVCAGLSMFGWYALKGEYDHLPLSSKEL
jgi:ABC-type molybdate transport system permease subunit